MATGRAEGIAGEARTPPAGARIWIGLLTAIVVGLVVLGAGILTAPARLDGGSFYVATSTSKLINDGYADTRYVVDGSSGGVLHVSVRNPSRLPVTILGLALTPQTPTALRSVSFDVDPFGPGVRTAVPAHEARQVKLGRDEEAGVLLEVRFPDCVHYDKGTSAIYTFVPLRVRRLGVTHTVRLPLDMPLWVFAAGDHAASGDCPG